MSLLTAVATAVLFVAAPVPKDGAKEDKDAIQGEWKVTSFVKNGENRAGADGGFAFKGTAVTVGEKGKEDTGTFTLDPKANPKAIDLTITDGPGGKTIVIKGIYKLEGDALTICFGVDGTDRPKEFAAPAGSRVGLFTLARAKK